MTSRTLPLVDGVPGRRKPPRHLADLTPAERRAVATEHGHPAFRAQQVARHYFGHHATDPADWTDIPAGARTELAAALTPTLCTPVRHVAADGGATRKTLWRLFDGTLVESVLMRYGGAAESSTQSAVDGTVELGAEADDGPDEPAGLDHPHRARATVCVSSQAGCGMGCPFCATGQGGLTRNLSAAEIVDQAVAAARALATGEVPGGPGRVSNVVFMGMGEPLANYKAVLGAVRRLTDPLPDGLGLSRRGITVSTVGLVPAMRRLTGEGLPVTLAVSLHAPDDELRDELVPINTRWPVAEVLDTARAYFDRTRRRVSIEYALIRDVNDQEWRGDQLGRLLADRGSGWVHVNPIPLNPTPGSRWTASRRRDQDAFVAAIASYGISVTVRDTRGRDIDGACGQLAAQA